MVFDYLDSSVEQQFRLRNGLVYLRIIRRWMGQVALGLSFLHGANIVHGDLSMSNMLLDSSIANHVRIADLGTAFAAGDVLDERFVADRGRRSAYTRAPEVCMGVTERACSA